MATDSQSRDAETASKYCPKCNASYNLAKKFCGKCGALLVVGTPVPAPPDTTPEATPEATTRATPVVTQSETPLTVPKCGQTRLLGGIAAAVLIAVVGYFGYDYVKNKTQRPDVTAGSRSSGNYAHKSEPTRMSINYKGVNDNGRMISPGERAKLERTLREFEESDSWEVGILTVSSLEGQTIEDYSMQRIEEWRSISKKNGILLVVSKADRKIRVEVVRDMKGRVTDLIAGRIIDLVKPRFKQGDYDGGFSAAIAAIIAETRGEFPSEEKPSEKPRILTEGLLNSPSEGDDINSVVSRFYDFVQNKNVDGAMGLYATEKLPQINRNQIAAVAKDTEYYRIEKIDAVEKGDTAKAEIILYHKKYRKNEEKWAVTIDLARENGSWKIRNTPGKRIK